jgi:small subunit ribosomal protein S19
MSRSKWKGFYTDKNLINKKLKGELKTTSRNSEIVPKFIKQTFFVHNGKTFTKVLVTEEMIGHKFGEFSPTRKKFSFKKK